MTQVLRCMVMHCALLFHQLGQLKVQKTLPGPYCITAEDLNVGIHLSEEKVAFVNKAPLED